MLNMVSVPETLFAVGQWNEGWGKVVRKRWWMLKGSVAKGGTVRPIKLTAQVLIRDAALAFAVPQSSPANFFETLFFF